MDILSALSSLGYAELAGMQDVGQVLRATEVLGRVMPLNGLAVQELVPRDKDVVFSNSFSKHYGHGSFPLHTDTAFWLEPARFVILYSRAKSDAATRVLPLQQTRDLMAIARCNNPIFLRKTVNGPIYSHPWAHDRGCHTIYDPCYMKSVNRAAEDFVVAALESAIYAKRFVWDGTNALVIDNWRVLHGRDDCSDGDRVIYRFYRGAAK